MISNLLENKNKVNLRKNILINLAERFLCFGMNREKFSCLPNVRISPRSGTGTLSTTTSSLASSPKRLEISTAVFLYLSVWNKRFQWSIPSKSLNLFVKDTYHIFSGYLEGFIPLYSKHRLRWSVVEGHQIIQHTFVRHLQKNLSTVGTMFYLSTSSQKNCDCYKIEWALYICSWFKIEK